MSSNDMSPTLRRGYSFEETTSFANPTSAIGNESPDMPVNDSYISVAGVADDDYLVLVGDDDTDSSAATTPVPTTSVSKLGPRDGATGTVQFVTSPPLRCKLGKASQLEAPDPAVKQSECQKGGANSHEGRFRRSCAVACWFLPIAIALITVGADNLGGDHCPSEDQLGSWMLVFGAVLLASCCVQLSGMNIVPIVHAHVQIKKFINVLTGGLSLFMLAWAVYGSVITFGCDGCDHTPSDEVSNPSGCDQGLYWFAFVYLIIVWVQFGFCCAYFAIHSHVQMLTKVAMSTENISTKAPPAGTAAGATNSRADLNFRRISTV